MLSYTELTINEKLTPAYASISVHSNASAQTIPTGSSYTKLTNFADNGLYKNCTPDAANDKITITETGIYRINGSFSFGCDTNNTDILGVAFVDGIEIDRIHFQRTIGTINSIGNTSISGTISVTSTPVDIDVRIRHDDLGSVDVNMTYMNLSIEKIDII